MDGSVSNLPKAGYREIFRTLRAEILSGCYDDCQVLPSENALAQRFLVCRPTVSRAMLELARFGLIARRRGAPALLSRFAKNASGAIGMIIQGEWDETMLIPQVCRKIGSLAEHAGWKVIRCGLTARTKRARIAEIKDVAKRLAAERVTGTFYQPIECVRDSFQYNRDVVSCLSSAGIQVVLLDYDIGTMPCRSEFDLVGTDNFMSGYALGRHLLERGAKNIAFQAFDHSAESVQNRRRGVMSAIIESGASWHPRSFDMTCRELTPKSVFDFIERHSPDAIVARNDEAALRLSEILLQRGVRVPDDIMLAGFDDIPAAATAPVPLTTMRQPVDAIASVALHTLASRIKDAALPARNTLLPCELVRRMSTRR